MIFSIIKLWYQPWDLWNVLLISEPAFVYNSFCQFYWQKSGPSEKDLQIRRWYGKESVNLIQVKRNQNENRAILSEAVDQVRKGQRDFVVAENLVLIFSGRRRTDLVRPPSLGSAIFWVVQLHQDLGIRGGEADGPVWSARESCSAFQREEEWLLHRMWRPWWWVQ